MTIISWCGFFGAWLLVAGPLYQGALELIEQEIDREGFAATIADLAPRSLPSAWWWVLPPVMLVLRQRRSEAYRREMLTRFTPEQRVQFTGYVQKATGWFVVAAGASLLAVKETWELTEHLEWPAWVFVVLLIVMFALALGNMSLGMAQKRVAG